MEPCKQIQKINQMESDIKELRTALTGKDGRGGMFKEMIILNQGNLNLVASVKELTIEVKELRETRIRQEGMKEQEIQEKETKDVKREVRQYIITTIIAISAIAASIIIALILQK